MLRGGARAVLVAVTLGGFSICFGLAPTALLDSSPAIMTWGGSSLFLSRGLRPKGSGGFLASSRRCLRAKKGPHAGSGSSISASSSRSSSSSSFGDVSSLSSLENPEKVDLAQFKSSLELYEKIRGCEDDAISGALDKALNVCQDGLRLFGPGRLITSYNGGKDAVVIMQLHLAAVAKYSLDVGRIHRPKAIYFNITSEFPEVREFVFRTSAQLGINLSVYNSTFSDGLTRCMAEGEKGSYGFLLGTRKGDPNFGQQQTFSPSSDWMPPFMRVNPIIEWDYGQVWRFLRDFGIPYPALYDQGYTSLGGTHDTFPNPALHSGGGVYLPAYSLKDWSLERAGRKTKEAQSPVVAGCDVSTHSQALSRASRVRTAKTAGLVIVGDEILKGRCRDTNTAFAASKLWEKGIVVQRVAVVQDKHKDIVEEVQRQAREYDVVFTSGGIGPTHDDVTIHAVADAFGQRLTVNLEMVETLRKQLEMPESQPFTEAQEKMTMLPENSRLNFIFPEVQDGKKNWPILQCENVFILPGVPQFFEKKLGAIADNLLEGNALFIAKLALNEDEFQIVAKLNEAVSLHPAVTIGSYPYVDNPACKTIVTVEAADVSELQCAVNSLKELLPQGSVVSSSFGENVLVPDDEDIKSQ